MRRIIENLLVISSQYDARTGRTNKKNSICMAAVQIEKFYLHGGRTNSYSDIYKVFSLNLGIL